MHLTYTPTKRAQVAIWIEALDGSFLATLALTESVAYRGVGNRPGALQMNSGFHWPYGRREGVLPIWAHARARQPGASLFRRVIFQNRMSEGFASRTSNDQSPDHYFCLSFNQATTQKDALDAVSCASVFNSDKGRYITQADLNAAYAEPWENIGGADVLRALSLESYYPPRRDAPRCTLAGCYDHPDVALYQQDARAIMPEIDAITTATPAGDTLQDLYYTVPNAWPSGDYVVFLEIHTEGDYDASYNASIYPTPTPSGSYWDSWAVTYGYPYRGQPSVVYRLPFTLTAGTSASTAVPHGYGALHGEDGSIRPFDGTIVDDPVGAPGSGADRLRKDAQGRRLIVESPSCNVPLPLPAAVGELVAETHPDPKNSHRWASLRFRAPTSDRAIGRYDVRVSTTPLVDPMDFERALPAKAPDPADPDDVVALQLAAQRPAGELFDLTLAGLNRETTYYVGARAVTICNEPGPYVVGSFKTTEIHFTTVSPCFIATAAYGTPMASDIQALRRLRDRHLMPHAAGRAAVGLYYAIGPTAADFIRERDELRTTIRWLLRPLVALARLVD